MISEFLDLVIRALARGEAAGGGSILLVLALRLPARRLIGAGLAYRLWALPLAAAIASLFPTLSEFMHAPGPGGGGEALLAPWQARLALAVWITGASLFGVGLLLSERRFRRRVAEGSAGPAVMGVGWHRLVTPRDFHTRFTAAERAFILRHERMHIARRDPLANLLIGVLQAISWFNPLVHAAAACARLDQELACDEAVIRHRPESRRGYAETLLKAHLSSPCSPFACGFAGAQHPLEVRLAMLARPEPGMMRQLAGASAVAAIGLVIAAAVWAAAPQSRPVATLSWDDQPPAAPSG